MPDDTRRPGQIAYEAYARALNLDTSLTWDSMPPRYRLAWEAAAKVAACPVSFVQDLTALLNRYSQENGSNTPDFILAEYLIACLAIWNTWIVRREKWYGRLDAPLVPGQDPLGPGADPQTRR